MCDKMAIPAYILKIVEKDSLNLQNDYSSIVLAR